MMMKSVFWWRKPEYPEYPNETRRSTTGTRCPTLFNKWHGTFYMPSRTDTAGYTKAFIYPAMDHWGGEAYGWPFMPFLTRWNLQRSRVRTGQLWSLPEDACARLDTLVRPVAVYSTVSELLCCVAGADPGILETGGAPPPHVNAEGPEKKWKSDWQLSVFLPSGTKIQGFIVIWKRLFNDKKTRPKSAWIRGTRAACAPSKSAYEWVGWGSEWVSEFFFILFWIMHGAFKPQPLKPIPLPVCGDPSSYPECMSGNGADYRGTTSVTGSGYTCQRWDTQTPHQHLYTDPAAFPDPTLDCAANFCRNPNNDFLGPWCPTTHPSIPLDYCFIPVCWHATGV